MAGKIIRTQTTEKNVSKVNGTMQATKGLGLTGDELIALRDALNEMEEE